MSDERRATVRVSSRIRVEVLEKNRVETISLNVSRNGIFIKEAADRPLNSLVRLRVYPPEEPKAIELLGRVAWKGSVEGTAGVGVHFLKLDSDDRDRWVEFVAQVEALDTIDPLSDHPHIPSIPEATSERRSAPRKLASFMVRFRTSERLREFVTRNVSTGGMFLETPVLKNLGDQVQVVIVHPDLDRDFEILAKVARLNPKKTDAEPKGMALEFLDLGEERQKELDTFLNLTSEDARETPA